ncbi:MAG: hypothetical protein ABJB16_06970 [Saprospiraceae bacterium]
MNSIYELAKFNLRYKRISDSLLPEEESSPLKKLYWIVFQDKVLTEEEAMLEVYGKRNVAAFSRLKVRLKDLLIRSILLQNTTNDSSDSRVSETINGYRYALVERLLITRKSDYLAIDIAEKAIVRSIKYHATENVLVHARILIGHYGKVEYNKYKLTKYLHVQEKYLDIYSWELKAENYYHDLLRTEYQSLATASQETKDKAISYVNDLDSVQNIRSYAFRFYRFRVKATYFEYAKDFSSLLDLTESALKEFNTPEFKSGPALFSINLRRIYALIQIGSFTSAISIGKAELEKVPSGSQPWYLMAHYVLKAQLYLPDYRNAIELIKSIIESPKFVKLGDSYKELFNTTLGYIHLIVDAGLVVNPIDLQERLPEFKLGKFLNATPVFSKDKRGINVSILLIHIAILLQRKDYSSIIDRIDSLNQYVYRYLRKDDSFRSNCMIKMVIQMTKADFHPLRTERYTNELYDLLVQVKLDGSGENIETEIIPYEVLWDIMKKSL